MSLPAALEQAPWAAADHLGSPWTPWTGAKGIPVRALANSLRAELGKSLCNVAGPRAVMFALYAAQEDTEGRTRLSENRERAFRATKGGAA